MSEQPRRRRRQQNIEIDEMPAEAIVETVIESPGESKMAIPQNMQYQYIPEQNKTHIMGKTGKNMVRKKRRKRTVVSILLAFIIIVGTAGIFLSMNGGKRKCTQVDISAINIAHGGELAVLGDKVYYIEDQETIWESDLEFTKGKKVLSGKWIYSICVGNDTIYYLASKDIYKYDLSTKQHTKLISMEKRPELLSYSNNQLIYIREKSLYSFDLSTQNEKVIVPNVVESFTCAADGIYYATLKSYVGSIYKIKDIDSEPELICELPFDLDNLGYDLYSNVSIDRMFVMDGIVYARKRYNLDGGWLFKSVSYQIDTKQNTEEALVTSIKDIHTQIPSPYGNGYYYILALNEEDKKYEFQKYYSPADPDSYYLSTFKNGKLAYGPNDSDWITELETDHKYYRHVCYYSNEGLIIRPSFYDRYLLYKFDHDQSFK